MQLTERIEPMESVTQIRADYPDEDLKRRVSGFLNHLHYPNLHELDVSVEHGVVAVQGVVPSYYEKQVALNACRRVAGVLVLDDRIEVMNKPK